MGFNGESCLLKKPSPAGKGDHEVVDEESIFVLIKGDLLIRHGFAVPPSPLEKALDKQFNAPINHNLKVSQTIG